MAELVIHGQNDSGVVIVGAGQAAGELTSALRQRGFEGAITVIGDESYPPYRRPPLSKSFLAGEVTLESLYVKPQESYSKQRIDCHYGVGVEAIDRNACTVRLFDGTSIRYKHLVLATGGRVRRLSLPGSDRANVHYVRTIDDILRLKKQFLPGRRLLVVGGGFIGLEAASVAIKHGLDVTIVEALPRVLARVTAPEVAAFYERAHRARGVKILTGVGVHALEGDPLVDTVILSDGSRIPADVVMVGIGVIPNTELADACGLEVANGIVVDSRMTTKDASIYSIGDCSAYDHEFLKRRVRLESVPSAADQAKVCAAVICGKTPSPISAPWFWSDQFDLKLQIVGLSSGYEEIAIRGDLCTESFCVFYLKNDTVIAVDAINRPAEFMISKKLVANRSRTSSVQVINETVSLKSLLAP